MPKSKKSPIEKPVSTPHVPSPQEKRVPATYLEQINPYVAGIDIGSRSHFVAAPVMEGEKHEIVIREFPSFTSDLEALADWLKTCHVTSVAMESTGVYWIPLYEILESRGFEVYLVDARRVKNVTGRKTDVADCQWIQQLHACGLLSGAYRPQDKILPLRCYTRQRTMLIESCASCVQHMQKAMTHMNIHLSNVISDVTGLTGMTIIRAIVDGERDPKKLAAFRDSRCKQPLEIIEKSLTGNFRPEHLFCLRQALASFDFYQAQLLKCDLEIERALIALNPDSEPGAPPESQEKLPRTYKVRGGNVLYFDAARHLQSLTGVDLSKIPGIDTNLALKIVSEIGADVSAWPNEKCFTSWLGLSPENKVSGGKQLSSKTKSSSNRTACYFRQAAFALTRSKTALGAFFRRKRATLGAPKAITATARKIAVITYNMLKRGMAYVEAGQHYYEAHYQQRVVKSLEKRASELGYALVPIPTQAMTTLHLPDQEGALA